jgi:hypothetical protein
LEERVQISNENMSVLRRANALGDEALDRANDAIEHAVEAQRLAEDRLNVWWRNPTFWFFIGSLVSIGLAALAVYVIKALQPDSVGATIELK